MNQPNFYGADFGFDSSNSSSTLTLKFDECEAITESSTLNAAGGGVEPYNIVTGTEATYDHSNSSSTAMMDSLRDNPVLTTASMPIPTRSAGAGGGASGQSLLCRLPDSDFGLDFDLSLSQDLNMPQMLLADGTDLNDDSSPTLFGLGGGHNQYSDHVQGNSCVPTSAVEQTRPIDVHATHFAGMHATSHNQQQHNHHLLSTATAGHQMWGSDANAGNTFIAKSEPLNLDDDAIYQVDKADLIQGHHFNDDPLLDISIDDISLLEDNHSLQPLQNVISPSNSSNISPSGYGNFYNLQQQEQIQLQNPIHQHHHNHQQQQQQHHNQQLQQLSPHQLMQPSQNLPVHSPPESVSLYETLNRSPYNLNTTNIVSPQTPTNSLSSHYQSQLASGAAGIVGSPRARPISINASSASQMRKYKTNAANQHTKRSALHDLLRKDVGAAGGDSANNLGQSMPGASGFSGQANAAAVAQRRRLAQYHHMQNSRLSSSAPTQLGMDQLWQRREPRPHLLSTSSVAEAESTSSLSTGGVLSPEAPDFSQDETYSDDSDHYEDFSSDDDSDGEQKLSKSLGSTGSGGGTRKMTRSERYFWQYNVQAKGPKGQRLVIKTEMEDPHVLNEVTDPVFSPNCSVRGIKHSGKARKGDGNDLTPNPRKLNAIGRELDKLFRVINDITPVAELPFNARTKTRKEKNKLASRACRLKKKAQHEANKIKLYGLEVEHKRLISGIEEMKAIISALSTSQNRESQEEVVQKIERTYQAATKVKIGGMSTEYVNQMIQKVKGTGMPNM